MKFIVDAQLPPALAEWLRNQGHEAAAVRDIGLREADDGSIWRRAIIDRAIIVTKDEDFVLFADAGRSSPQILWVRTGNLVNRLLFSRFEKAWSDVEGHLSNGAAVVELR